MSTSSPYRHDADDAVASPCMSVCVMLEPAHVCVGCFRTLDEIAEWSTLDAAGKRAVLAALPGRREALGFGTNVRKADADAER